MIIEPNSAKYCVLGEQPISDALRKINENKTRVIFVVNTTGRLEGVLSDGDLRRWLVTQSTIDLDRPVRTIAKRSVRSALVTEDPGRISAMLHDGVDAVPLLDAFGHVVAIATTKLQELAIGEFTLRPDSPAFVIAEIGNNHNGSVETAMRLVDAAQAAGADCVKFQMRHLESLYRNAGDPTDASEDLGAQYTLDILSRFNLRPDQLFEIFDYCHSRSILPLCTPWDLESVEALERYGVAAYKVASADLTHHDLLRRICSTRKPLLLSTGMSTEGEINDSVQLLRSRGAAFALLHCNSTYPTPFKDIQLACIRRLSETHRCLVGYSGHERGFHVAVAAVALGAKVIEKHFTFDREMEGNDHKVSLLPAEFAAMVRAIRDVESAIGTDQERSLSQGELINREILAKSLVARNPISRGESITDVMIAVKSPGRGLPPSRRQDLIGRRALRDIPAGDFFYPSDLLDAPLVPRPYRFRRPWGVPVRFHDAVSIVSSSNPVFVEYHLSYRDLDVRIDSYLDRVLDVGFIVHAPEMFAGDTLLDLCSLDEAARQGSIDAMNRVADVARALAPYHSRSHDRVPVVTNVGGFTLDEPLDKGERMRRYDRLIESLHELDRSGIEILPQTMPPFPWHFGGQRYHNLFVDPHEIDGFCRDTGIRICLDVSHSKLACTHHDWSLHDFVALVGPHTAHLHIADAEGVDGEGLQIGDGSIDFGALAHDLDLHAPGASFIPEIWQGHKNDGEGFWQALERLEQWL